MASYLVTGGCGFIGSHLVDTLLSNGHRVIVIDDLSSGKRENLSPNAELIVGDVCDLNLVINTLSQVDACFHLAALLGMVACKENWLGTNRVNLVGTLTLFEAARLIREKHHKTLPIVYTSSCSVYGDAPYQPITEISSTAPLSAYGADKLACELHARVATIVHGIPTIGLRLFNVYGSRQNANSIDSGAIPIFIDKVQKNAPITIFGDGEQTRDFVHVSDVVNHFIFFMENMHLAPDVFNVCTGNIVTINRLIDLMRSILQKPIEKIYQPPRPGDVLHSHGDPSKAIALGVHAKVRLANGLEQLLE